MRTFRKSMVLRSLFIASDASLVDFGFGSVAFFSYWKRHFAKVYGYEINPESIRLANKAGLSDVAALQDITVDFDPLFRADFAVCFYVFEHVSDRQCAAIVRNMSRSAPVNVIVLTDKDDDAYHKDDTHTNPKTSAAWNKMISSWYGKMGWKRVFRQYSRWVFARPGIVEMVDATSAHLEYTVDKHWREWRERSAKT
jgi:hypothetical protein